MFLLVLPSAFPITITMRDNDVLGNNYVQKFQPDTVADGGQITTEGDATRKHYGFLSFNTSNVTTLCGANGIINTSKVILDNFQIQAGSENEYDSMHESDNFSNNENTWNNNPCGTSGAIGGTCNATPSANISITATGIYHFNANATMKKMLAQSRTNVSFVFAMRDIGADANHAYRSSTAVTGQKPILNVTCSTTAEAPTTIIFFNNDTNTSTPRLNDVVNFSISINMTGGINVSWATFSWDNGTGTFLNDSPINLQLLQTNSTTVNVNKTIFNQSGVKVQWIWYANATNGAQSNNGIESLTVAGFDAPNVTINSNNFFNLTNKTIISLNKSQSVLLNLSFIDDMGIFGFEINITLPNGSLVFNLTNISLSGTYANFSSFINVSGPQGFYNVSIEVSDSHTAKSIPNFKVDKGLSYLRFDDAITIEAEGAIWSSTEKLTDRYDFRFNYLPFIAPKNKIFYIESINDLKLITNSGFKAHFVDYISNKWIDFEGVEGQPIITKISDKRYKVEFSHKGSSITFKSIGGLNRNVFYYQYYLSNVSINWLLPTTNPTNYIGTSFSVSLNVTGNGRNFTRFYLFNSSDNQVQTINVSNNGTGTFFYNATFLGLSDTTYRVNATHIDINLENSTSTTLTFNNIQLNDCGAGYPAINFTLKDEENSSRVKGDSTAKFQYNGTTKNFELSKTYTNQDNFSICIFPASESIIADYQLTYEATGYPKRALSATDITLSNSTQLKNLFLLKTASGIYATFSVIDAFNRPLTGVQTTMKIASSNTTIEIRNTDDSGVVAFFENPDTTYSFTFVKTSYRTQIYSLRITSTDLITITLEPEESAAQQSIYAGFDYSFKPINEILNNNTAYNFTFNLTSSYWNLTDCEYYLKNNSQTLGQANCAYNASRSNSTFRFNTGNQTSLISEAIYQINGTTNVTVLTSYSVRYTYQGQFSLKTFFDDIKNFSGAGFNDFTRIIAAVIIIFGIVAGLAYQVEGFRDVEAMLFVVWGLVFLFSLAQFLTIPYDGFPNIGGIGKAWLQQYALFLLTSLVTIGYTIRRHNS